MNKEWQEASNEMLIVRATIPLPRVETKSLTSQTGTTLRPHDRYHLRELPGPRPSAVPSQGSLSDSSRATTPIYRLHTSYHQQPRFLCHRSSSKQEEEEARGHRARRIHGRGTGSVSPCVHYSSNKNNKVQKQNKMRFSMLGDGLWMFCGRVNTVLQRMDLIILIICVVFVCDHVSREYIVSSYESSS